MPVADEGVAISEEEENDDGFGEDGARLERRPIRFIFRRRERSRPRPCIMYTRVQQSKGAKTNGSFEILWVHLNYF